MTAINEPGDYHALALALRPSQVEHGGLRLKIFPDAIEVEAKREDAAALSEIQAWLTTSGPRFGPTWRWDQAHSPSISKPHPKPVNSYEHHELEWEPS